MLGVFISLEFLEIKNPIDFVGTSLFAGIILYFVFFFPKNILIKDGVICFMVKNRLEKTKIKLVDVAQIEYGFKFYNIVTIITKTNRKYLLHPKDAKALIDYIQSHKQI